MILQVDVCARPVKSVKVRIVNSAECAQMYNKEPNSIPSSKFIRCFQPLMGEASLDEVNTFMDTKMCFIYQHF